MEAGEGGAGGGVAGVAGEAEEHPRIKCRSLQIILFESFVAQSILFTCKQIVSCYVAESLLLKYIIQFLQCLQKLHYKI